MMNEHKETSEKEPIILVSGLPRSGTSMMMQMLEAGGLHIVTDRIRKADKDNPKGYYELEKVKNMQKDGTAWLDECHGKVIKMISALLYQLPHDKHFKVLFMKRDLKEVLASQKVMLQRLGKEGTNLSDEDLAEKFESHLTEIKQWLSGKNNFDLLYVNFKDVIQKSDQSALAVAQFLNKNLDTGAMSRVVEKKLYRQKI